MKGVILRQFIVFIFLSQCISALSQNIPIVNAGSNPVLDSLKSKGVIFNESREKPEIKLTVSQAVKYLQQRYQSQSWNNLSDPFRQAMGELIFNASNPPLDTAIHILKKFPYDSISIPWDKFYIWEPMRVRIPVSAVRQLPVTNEPALVQDTSTINRATDSVKVNYDKAPLPEYSFKTVTVQKDTSLWLSLILCVR